MKSIVSTLVLATLISGFTYAQNKGEAIGLRLGYDAQEISFQLPLSMAHRLEFTVGANTLGFNQAGLLCRGIVLNGIYQWVKDLSGMPAGLKWYLGLGVAVLDHGSPTHGMYGTGVTGQIGVEYNFVSPWQLSLDYRPGFYWMPGSGNIYRFSWNVPCLALRYHL